jgi:CRP-like cAMP-binding protein
MIAKTIDREAFGVTYHSHADMWEDLCGVLTIEEGNALFHAMQEDTFYGEQPIFSQGGRNSNLYFVKQGQLRILYSKGGRDVFLKMLRPGDIAGEDTFFSDSLCTATVTPFSYAKLRYLERRTLLGWQNEFPGLELKLYNYCLKFEQLHDLLSKKGLDRRGEKRFKICGKVIVQILSVYGGPIGKTIEGDLWDISASGLSCFVRLERRENARYLVGRDLTLEVFIPTGEEIRKIEQNGIIVAVRSNPFEHYSLHVKFSQIIDRSFMQALERFTIVPLSRGLID